MNILFFKKIGMSARSCKEAFFFFNGIYKNPIKFYMQFSMIFPFSFQLMIFVCSGKWSFPRQNFIHRFLQFGHIIAAPRHLFYIASKICCIIGNEHLNSKLSEKIISIFGSEKTFPAFNCLHSLPGFFIRDFLAVLFFQSRFSIKGQTLVSCDFCNHQTNYFRESESGIMKRLFSAVPDVLFNLCSNISGSRHDGPPYLSKFIQYPLIVKTDWSACHGHI